MTYRIHCINGLPYLLFPISEEIIILPPKDQTNAFNLSQQQHFLDPLTKAPLYTLQGPIVIRNRDPISATTITDELLCKLTEIAYIPHENPKHQIEHIQTLLSRIDHPNTISGLYEIVEQLAPLTYGPGSTPQNLFDSLNPGYRLICSDVTALTAACISAWNIPVRIGTGFGLNLEFECEQQRYHYFLDSEPGFGPDQHCWLEVCLNNAWVIFDPTIYLNKFKTNPSPTILQKYREIAIQQHSQPFLYQWAVADYFPLPFHENFRKTLLMFSGGIDSTAVLVDLLTNTTDIVQVHHVTLGTDIRVQTENQHAREIIAYCQLKYRPFVFTESTIDTTAPNGGRVDDIYHIMYGAAQVVRFDHRGHPFDRVVCGALQLDEEEHYTPGAIKRVGESTALFEYLMYMAVDIPQPHCHIVYNPNWTKKVAWEILPPALREQVWYCRKPMNNRPCGSCETCIHVQEVVR